MFRPALSPGRVPVARPPPPPAGGPPGGVPAKAYFRVISIHALREEGDLSILVIRSPPVSISIHALREEGDANP